MFQNLRDDVWLIATTMCLRTLDGYIAARKREGFEKYEKLARRFVKYYRWFI